MPPWQQYTLKIWTMTLVCTQLWTCMSVTGLTFPPVIPTAEVMPWPVDRWAWMGGCGGKKVNLQITFACTLTIQNMPKERQSTAAKESACPGPEWKEELLTMAEMKLECIGRQYKSCSSWNQSNQLTAFQQWLICTYVHTSQPYEIKLNSWQEFSPIDWQTKWST